MSLLLKRLLILAALIVLTGLSWFGQDYYDNANLTNVFYSLLGLSALYTLIKVILAHGIVGRVSDQKSRYSLRKSLHLGFIVLFLLMFIAVWLENFQALLVAYGLVAAGVAIALQDFFKNLAGGVILFTMRPYSVGDRIELNGKTGDVIDIGFFYTTVMELREWIDGDQATGRLSHIPNGDILSYDINNFSKDHDFIWDEIALPITYDSDWKKAQELITEIAKKAQEQTEIDAEETFKRLGRKYYVARRETDPFIFVTLTDNWITLTLRYVTAVRERRIAKHLLNKKILAVIEQTPAIQIASETTVIKHAGEDSGL